jgi:hypothetical protein
MNVESAIQAMKKGIENGQSVMNEFPESFTQYPALDIPKELRIKQLYPEEAFNEPTSKSSIPIESFKYKYEDILNNNNKDNYTLGNEPGYRRLEAGELVQEGDETYGAMSNTWETANTSQIGKPAHRVGGFYIWRRKL